MPRSMLESILNWSKIIREWQKTFLKKAFENKYGQSTGTYMWQVARLHYHRLLAEESLPKK